MLSGLNSIMNAAKKIQEMGAKNVIVTGSGETKNVIDDFVLEESRNYNLKGKKIKIINHGSGCNYSASITASLAMKKTVHDSALFAKEYVFQSIKNSKSGKICGSC